MGCTASVNKKELASTVEDPKASESQKSAPAAAPDPQSALSATAEEADKDKKDKPAPAEASGAPPSGKKDEDEAEQYLPRLSPRKVKDIEKWMETLPQFSEESCDSQHISSSQSVSEEKSSTLTSEHLTAHARALETTGGHAAHSPIVTPHNPATPDKAAATSGDPSGEEPPKAPLVLAPLKLPNRQESRNRLSGSSEITTNSLLAASSATGTTLSINVG
eukprot:NODE_5581_length_930_cov_72.933086_g5358_i0.p1 GENE.NODE_5581_length_930_cov_72.933086_g5358_i0~~NODE_5581_length_930_cov_72.933086_g5358_i0.p1  ORF type:complete len:220 (-),score=35.97 NODE_5581_length_930_cov_72.933086_g5358_i0:206-865(-)